MANASQEAKNITPTTSEPTWKGEKSLVAKPLTRRQRMGVLVGTGAMLTMTVAGGVGVFAARANNKEVPQPTPWGTTVDVIPEKNEGSDQMIRELTPEGMGNDALADTIHGAEENGVLPDGPIAVDGGIITHDEKMLLRYGVRSEELEAANPQFTAPKE